MCKFGLSGGNVNGAQVRPCSSYTPTSAEYGKLAPPNSSGTSSPQSPSSLHVARIRPSSSSVSPDFWPALSRASTAFSSGIRSRSTNFATNSCSILCSSGSSNMHLNPLVPGSNRSAPEQRSGQGRHKPRTRRLPPWERTWQARRQTNGGCPPMPNQPRDLSRVRSAAQPTGYTIREHRIPTEDARPYILAQGPDGHIWFCEHGADKIGRLSTIDYRFSEFSLPAKASMPIG